MSQQEVKLHFSKEITDNPISQLGKKKFGNLLDNFSSEQLRQSLYFHQNLLTENTNNIMRGTAYAIGGALLYRLGPQHEVLQFIEGIGIVLGTSLGTLGVYGRSACVDGINIITDRIHRLRG